MNITLKILHVHRINNSDKQAMSYTRRQKRKLLHLLFTFILLCAVMLGKCLVPFFKINTEQPNKKKHKNKNKSNNQMQITRKEKTRIWSWSFSYFKNITRMRARVCSDYFLPFFKTNSSSNNTHFSRCWTVWISVQDKWLMHRKLKNMHLISKQINVQR